MSTKKTVLFTSITALTGGLFVAALSVQAVAKSDNDPRHPGFYRDRLPAAEVTTKRTMPSDAQLNNNSPLPRSYFTPCLTGGNWEATGKVSTTPYRDANDPLQPGYRRH